MILPELFLSFLKIGIFSIGGGYAAVPLIKEQVLEVHGWLTPPEFSDLVTVSEMTPGPIGINAASFVGARLAGIAGAVCASAGFVVPSLVFVTLLFFIYKKYSSLRAVDSVLKGIRPAVTGLIASTAVTMIISAVIRSSSASINGIDIAAAALFVLSFALLRKFRLSPIVILLICGAAGFIIYYLFNRELI